MIDFYDFGNYINIIKEQYKKYGTILVYGEESIGKTTYINQAILDMGLSCKTNNLFDNYVKYYRLNDENTIKKLQINTIIESNNKIDGMYAIRITKPTLEQKNRFLSVYKNIKQEIKLFILNNHLTPFQIFCCIYTNGIIDIDKKESQELTRLSPDNCSKRLFDYYNKRNKLATEFNKLKIFDYLRYNNNSEEICKKMFGVVVDNVCYFNEKIPTRKI